VSRHFKIKTLVFVCGLMFVILWFHGWDTVSATDWREGALAGTPRHQGVHVTPIMLAAGRGMPIRAGELVRVGVRELPDIAPGTFDMFIQTNEPPSQGEGWLYIGDLDAGATKFGPTFVHTINREPRLHSNYDLGAADFRAALAGCPTGSVLQLAIDLPSARSSEMFATGLVGVLPANGFFYDYDLYSQSVDPLKVSQPAVRLTYGHSYEVTVHEACPARLLVQDVTMRQFGPRMICTNTCILCCSASFFREARMQFALMDARCAGGKTAHFGPIAVIDKDVTPLPREFQESVEKRMRRLAEHWPVSAIAGLEREEALPRSVAHEESDIERRVREAEERANGKRP
jgi:hypothetical protein